MALPSLTAGVNLATDSHPLLVISACLLGDQVRYDGDHKRDSLLVGPLADHVQWLAVCPEVELGLGVPREKIQLEAASGGTQLVSSRSRQNLTVPMQQWAAGWARSHQERGICGFVLKSASPSCGVGDARVWEGKASSRQGNGLFAEAVMQSFPAIPVTTEKQIQQPGQLEHFLVRVFARERLLKLLVEPHGERRRQLLGQEELLLETYQPGSFEEIVGIQQERLLVERHAAVLSCPVTWKKHRGTLLAACGQLKGDAIRDLEGQLKASAGDKNWTYWTTELFRQARDQGNLLASQSYLQPIPVGCLPAEEVPGS